ncbi:integrase, catalytic region, zinc finger, CCHC-type containing protein [Tanacetum coccineum]
MLGEVSIHMLVEKKYPLPQDTLTRMLQWKLHVNNDVTEMAYELLRFIRSQLQKEKNKFLGTVYFGNDHVVTILGYGDLQWGNILIVKVYYVEGLGHNLFSVGQFCVSDLEVAFRRNTCFVKNLEGVDLLKGNRTTNLYTINLHEMAYASLICLIARATSTKSCINGKRYVLVIMDDYSCYTWVHFLRSKDEAPEEIKIFLKKITFLLQALVILVRTNNDTKFKNQVLKEYFDSVGISHQASSVRIPQQNGIAERRNRTLVEAARIMLIFSCAPALYYPKNDREDIGKLGAKGDIGFFIGYFATSYAYRVYNRMTKIIMETINVTFDELSAMAFKQRSLKPGLQGMTSGQINTASTPKNSSPQAADIPNTSQDVEELETEQQHVQQQDDQAQLQTKTVANNVPNAMLDGDTFVNPFAPPSTSAAESSSSQYVDPSNMHTNQLRIDGDMCIYALTVSIMEPRNVKEAMNDPAWIDSMQEELLQFKRLDVWVLVPPPDNIKPLTLKWLFKNKHDKENMIIRNKSCLQVKRRRSNYVLEILKKYGIETCDPIGTPMEIKDKLDLDKNGTLVDAKKYRSMIGAPMYLTSSRPDIVHAICLCAQYQAKPTEKHLKEVKRIVRYLWGTVNMGL